MPVTIYVRSADENAPTESCPSLTFDGPRVVIGRGPSCEVRLPDASVSHRHATLQVAAGGISVTDEGSRNGTFVGNRKLAIRAPHTLRSGELVRVGRVWLEIRSDQRPATRDLSLATKDLALALVSHAMRALGDDDSPRIRVEEGPDAGTELTLSDEGRVYVIGRGETCELPLADADASREHVQVVRRAGTVLARDRGSKNGSALDGQPLASDRDVPWKSGQALTLAQTLLLLVEPAAAALRSIEDAEDELLGPADVPPPPSAAPPPSARPSEPPSVPTGTPAPIDASRPKAPRARISFADVTLAIAALIILVLSLVGLVWLLKT
jgi:pSer/pThr/pTyr-binding forkhead associated (FHA) protein